MSSTSTSDNPSLEAGSQLGDYIIEAEIGGGGMAKVYRVRHSILETVHALKVLDPAYRAQPEARKRFLEEARIQAKHLGHPGIVRVTNIVATQDAAALVMELIEGPSLEAYIQELNKPPSEQEFLALALPILSAVGYAHSQGIIHRDIKPANILLARRPEGLVPVVTDFGIAKVSDKLTSKKSTHADARMGTLSYMSPEQIRKAKEVTARSDVFSLGTMFYELATRTIAFDGGSDFDVMEKIVHGRFEPPERKVAGLSPRIAAAITRAMQPDPDKRFASCEDFAAALSSGAPIALLPAHAGSSSLRVVAAAPPPGGSRLNVVIALVVLALAAGGGAIYLATRNKSAPTKKVVVAPPPDAGVGDEQLLKALRALQPDAAVAIEEPVPVPDPEPHNAAATPAPVPDPVAPEPPPPDCFGSWGDKYMHATIDSKGDICGSYAFGTGSFQCAGQLSGCIVTQARVNGIFACKYNNGVQLKGTMVFSACNPSGASGAFTVNDSAQSHSLKPMAAPGKGFGSGTGAGKGKTHVVRPRWN